MKLIKFSILIVIIFSLLKINQSYSPEVKQEHQKANLTINWDKLLSGSTSFFINAKESGIDLEKILKISCLVLATANGINIISKGVNLYKNPNMNNFTLSIEALLLTTKLFKHII